MSKKYNIQDRINEIATLTTSTLPQAMASGIDIEEYFNIHRRALNLTLFQTLLGCEFIPSKKDPYTYDVKTSIRKLPTMDDELTIARLIKQFRAIENDYIKSNAVDPSLLEDDDMAIPVETIPHPEKINKKSLQEYIFGNNGISNMMIDEMDVFELAAIGNKIRKKKMRNMLIVIGGATLLLTGGGIVAACIAGSKSKNDDDIDDDVVDVDIDPVDIDPVDVDIPSVEFNEAVI